MTDADRQLRVIAEVVGATGAAGIDVWLRGGWAMDFFLGEVTRPHRDIDWFCRADDADRLVGLLHGLGCTDDPGVPPEQQRDLFTADGTEIGFALFGRDADGCPTVAAGPYRGERWPANLVDGPPGRLGGLNCPIVSAEAQIEVKEMMPIWVPGLPRRAKDTDDIARLRAALTVRDH